MKYKVFCGCALFAFVVALTPAQTKSSMSGKCGKPDVQQNIPAGDSANHVFTLAQGKCETKGKVDGAASKEGAFSEHGEVTGDRSKVSGVYVETFDGGDKIFYTYQNSVTLKDGAPQAGQGKYQISAGTGKMKGIKGSGTCKITPNANGGIDYSCTGEYTLGGTAPAKQ
jgi:hypothetical protein